MFTAFSRLRNPLRLLSIVVTATVIAACQPIGGGGGNGPRISGEVVEVAMLIPYGSAQGGDELVARSLENAARLAASEMRGVTVNITVYSTAGQAAQAASAAQQAASDGADIIIGPLRSDAAAAVGIAVANNNINVLSFSNNTEIAGGNVFVLGNTYANTANRIIGYAARQGRNRLMVIHAQNFAGEIARDAVVAAASNAGATVVANIGYEFSQTGVVNVVQSVTSEIRATDANGVVLTSDAAGALPLFAQLLPENGLDTTAVQMIGLSRWDTPPQTLELSGLQGGWFAMPDPDATARFNANYQAAYGENPHVLAALAYDAVVAIAETTTTQGRLGAAELTASSGFNGAGGVFRLRSDGTNERAMAIAQVIDNQVAVIDPAPRLLGFPGF